MNKELRSILLIDDNPDDNFFHERAIRKVNSESVVVAKDSGFDALEYLKSTECHTDLIFLDINMPKMNGWEFLVQYGELSEDLKCDTLIIMLTTSDNIDDLEKARISSSVTDFITKPLTKEKMDSICKRYFS